MTSHLSPEQLQDWRRQLDCGFAQISDVFEACMAEGPQMVTKRGAEAAVLVPVDEWRRLQAAARPSLKQLLLSDEARAELLIPARGSARRRKVTQAG